MRLPFFRCQRNRILVCSLCAQRGLRFAVSRGEPQRGFRRDYRLSTPPAVVSRDRRARRGLRSASPSVSYPATRAAPRAACAHPGLAALVSQRSAVSAEP
jgi:hypothetical protein